MKRNMICAAAAAVFLLTCGCSEPTYEGFSAPEQSGSTLEPVAALASGSRYEGIAPTAEPTEAEYSSADGLCVIRKKKSYFDVTLDLTTGDHKAAGAAYAEAIQEAMPDYEAFADDYLNELIRLSFESYDENDTPKMIAERIDALKAALPEEYREELEGFAGGFSGGTAGIAQDGKLSRYEADLLHLVPDVLRNYACSTITADGSRTASGKRISARILEWDLGRDNKMCTAHSVLHFKNGDRSLISVSTLGILDVVTGVNDNGVMAADLDVGTSDEFTCENKIAYSFAMREALEQYSTAREAGEYLTAHTPQYTYSHNVFLTDAKDAFVAENCVAPEGKAILRDEHTPLADGLTWNAAGCVCAVNAYAAEGNPDGMTVSAHDITRWKKYERMFGTGEKLTVSRFKELLTSEPVDSFTENIRSQGVVFLLIADYDTNTLQAAFTGTEGIVDTPEFVDLGRFC